MQDLLSAAAKGLGFPGAAPKIETQDLYVHMWSLNLAFVIKG